MNAQTYILIGLGLSVFALLGVLLWAGRPEAAARRRLKRSSPSNDVLRQWAAYRGKGRADAWRSGDGRRQAVHRSEA